MCNLSSAPPVYIRRAHQNTSGSVVSELMRFIYHIITYVVPVMPKAINWARPLIQTPPVMNTHVTTCMSSSTLILLYMYIRVVLSPIQSLYRNIEKMKK